MPLSVKLLPFSIGRPEGKNRSIPDGSKSHQKNVDDLTIVLAEDLWFASLECFLETAGLTAALPVLRPISKGFAKLSEQGSKGGNRLSNLDQIVSCECLLSEIMLGSKAEGEMLENGARIHKSGCKLEGRCPEICFLCCQMMGEACTEAMNPGYDHLLVESISRGDLECGWVLRKLSETSFDLGARIQFHRFKPEEGEIETIRALLHKTYVESWMTLTEAFVRTIGEEKAVPALEKSSRSLGITKGEEYSSALGIADLDNDSTGYLVEKVSNLLEISGMSFSSRSSPAILLQIEALCKGVIEAVNPDSEPSYDKGIGTDRQLGHWLVRGIAIEVIPVESNS